MSGASIASGARCVVRRAFNFVSYGPPQSWIRWVAVAAGAKYLMGGA